MFLKCLNSPDDDKMISELKYAITESKLVKFVGN